MTLTTYTTNWELDDTAVKYGLFEPVLAFNMPHLALSH